ncbi:MAG: phosphate ABC transporter ATP-binding protein [Chloroflexi bacterium]|nr:phosphate ABC transporter ATP-binding protein [Chloroflexota bacterium]
MSVSTLYNLEKVTKSFGERRILNIDILNLPAGELFAVVGPSGAGKSTLLRICDFLEAPSSGQVFFYGEPITLPMDINLRRRIGMVFQRTELLSGTVRQNIAFPLRLRGINDGSIIDETLKRLDLVSLADSPSHTLSGGEVQRVAFARLLVVEPEVLLLDEPTANLDPYNVELIETIIRELHQDGTTILMITHNVFQARRLADRVGLLLNGELVEVSNVDKFFDNPDDERALAFVRGQMVY